MENIKKFYDALSNDKALQERANALFKGDEKPDETTPPFGHPSKEGNNKAAVVAFANAEGYDFSLAELEACAQPLADDVMSAVAGGIIVVQPLPAGRYPPGNKKGPIYPYAKDDEPDGRWRNETGPDGIFHQDGPDEPDGVIII